MTVAWRLCRFGCEFTINTDNSVRSIAACSADGDALIQFENVTAKPANDIVLAALIAVGTERRTGEDHRSPDAAVL